MEAGIICVGSSSGPLYLRCALGDINCPTAKVLGPCLRLSAQWEEVLRPQTTGESYYYLSLYLRLHVWIISYALHLTLQLKVVGL